MALDVSALSDFNNEVAGELIPKMVYTEIGRAHV